MSSRTSLKYQKSFATLDQEYRKQVLEKSAHNRSKSRSHLPQAMAKSFYSGISADKKQGGFHQGMHTLSSMKAERVGQINLKKHQNKKFNKLASLIAYAITSADKAIAFLDISCNFQVEFASNLYFSDRQALIKELNSFEIDNLAAQKSLLSTINTLDSKSIILEQSLLLESTQLRQENQRLKKQVTILESELSRQAKNGILQSKSTHNFFNRHEISECNALLMTKSCEFDHLREEFDFIELEHQKMADLLKKVCAFNETFEFLDSIREESKWKIECLNTERTELQKRKLQELAMSTERRTAELQAVIVNRMQGITFCQAEKLQIQNELMKTKLQCELLAKEHALKCEKFALKQAEFALKEVQLSEEAIKLGQYIILIQQKLKNIQSLLLAAGLAQDKLDASVEHWISKIISRNRQNEQQITIKRQQNEVLASQICNLREQKQSLDAKLEQASSQLVDLQQSSKAVQIRLASQLERLHQQVIGKDKQILHYKAVTQQTQLICARLQQQIKQSQIQISTHKLNLSIAQSQSQQLAKEIDAKMQALSLLDVELLEREKQINHLQAQRDSNASELKATFDKIKSYSQQIMILQGQLTSSADRNQQLQRILQREQREMAACRSNYQANLSNHQARIRQYEANLATLHSLHDNLQAILNDSRQKSAETIKTLQSLITHLKQENDTVKQENADIKKQCQALKQANNKITVKAETASNEEMNHLIIQRDAFKENLARLLQTSKQKQLNFEATIASQNIEIKKLQQQSIEISELKAKKEQLNKQIAHHQQELTIMQNLCRQTQSSYKHQLQQAKDEMQALLKERLDFSKQVHLLQTNLTKQAQQRQRLIKLAQQDKDQWLAKLKEKDQHIAILSIDLQQFTASIHQQQSKISDALIEKQALEQQLKTLKQLQQEQEIQKQTIQHDHAAQISHLKKQLAISIERSKNMQVDKIIIQKQINDASTKHKYELSTLQENLAQRQTAHRKQLQELCTTLSVKQTEIDELMIICQQLTTQLQAHAHKIEQLQYKKKELEQQLKQKEQKTQKALQNSLPHIQMQGQNGENNFTDFGSYIEHKMEDSFVSIIHSETAKQDSKVFVSFSSEHPSNKQQGDEFEDFSSSQAEQIMYSMSSHNESTEHPIACIPQIKKPQLLLPSAQPPLIIQPQQSNESMKLRRTFSIIKEEDPVVQSQVVTRLGDKALSLGALKGIRS